MYQVQEFAHFAVTVNLGVEDLRDLELRFAIHLDWWWWRLDPVQNGIGYGWFELGDMENWVNCVHGVWKAECEGERAYLGDDGIGPKVLFS